jgi:hypothetical protein
MNDSKYKYNFISFGALLFLWWILGCLYGLIPAPVVTEFVKFLLLFSFLSIACFIINWFSHQEYGLFNFWGIVFWGLIITSLSFAIIVKILPYLHSILIFFNWLVN